jgi:NADH-quinone oxidoreductase subunit N
MTNSILYSFNDFYSFAPEFLLIILGLILVSHFSFISTTKEYAVLINYSSNFIIYILFLILFLFCYNILNYETIQKTFFNNSLILDNNLIIIKIFLLLISIYIILISKSYFISNPMGYFEYNLLLICGITGSLFTICANDFLILYIALEIQALAFYIMSCLKKSSYSTESALKYFIIGSFASSILIFGISIIVLITGHYNFENIKNFLIYTYKLKDFFIIYIYLGSLLILVALLFKLAIAPFHNWVADIYEGITTPTALFFATVPKISIFVILTRIIYDVFYNIFYIFQPFLIICCCLSLILGAHGALKQQNIKRFLAFSSVHNFGFILIGISLNSQLGINSSFIYLFIYILLTLALWTCILILSYTKYNRNNKSIKNISKTLEFNGFIKNNPTIAIFIFLLLLSMGGIPPLIGFYAKSSIFLSIINILDTQFNNNFNTIYFFSQEINFVILILIVLITSCYSIYYYLKIVKIIFFENKQNKTPPVFNINSNIVAYTFLGFIFIFNFTGIFFFN